MSKFFKNFLAILIFCITGLALIYVKFIEKEKILTPVNIKTETVYSRVQIKTIPANFTTKIDPENNIDSLAIWQNWLLATAKATNKIIIYNATNGQYIKEFGSFGKKLGEFSRPNGIFIIDNFAFITERDNGRVQVFSLPNCNPIGFVGQDSLKKPYGVALYKTQDETYNMYVTDDYKTEQISELDKRVHIYQVDIKENKISSKLLKTFGDIQGPGVLYKVESILIDKEKNRLFVADEHKSQKNIKIYTLNGKFTGEFLGLNMFNTEPEGIALYETSKNAGFIVATDQDHKQNNFHIFDRETLKHLISFKAENTTNTDGITITNKPIGNFSKGAFYAVNNDRNVTIIDWEKINIDLELDRFIKKSATKSPDLGLATA